MASPIGNVNIDVNTMLTQIGEYLQNPYILGFSVMAVLIIAFIIMVMAAKWNQDAWRGR